MESYGPYGGGTRAISMRELRDMPFDQLASRVERAAARTAGAVGAEGGGRLLPPLPSLARAVLLPRARSTSHLPGPDADGWPLFDTADLRLCGTSSPRGRISPSRGRARELYHTWWLPDLDPGPAPRRRTGAFRHSRDGGGHGVDGGYEGLRGDSMRSAASHTPTRGGGGGSGLGASGSDSGFGGGGDGDLPLSYEQLLLLDEGRVRRGVRPEVVRALPTHTATRVDSSSQCQVCLERFRPGATRVATLPCAHAFCAPCIRPWLAGNATCPVCRWAFPQHQTRLMLEPQESERPTAESRWLQSLSAGPVV